MFGRIFGRGKDDQDEAVCADCGRTLLAGEWTQTIIDEQGHERLICSLCGQAYAGAGEPVAAAPTPANNGRMRETRSETVFDDYSKPADLEAPESTPAPAAAPADTVPARDTRAESDAFWQALKEKDAQIERIKAELARAEAERQELAGQFARLGAAGSAAAAAEPSPLAAQPFEPQPVEPAPGPLAAQPVEPEPGSLTGDSSEPGEHTWGETPAEFAAEMAALRETEAAQRQPLAADAEAAVPRAEPVPATEPEPATEAVAAPAEPAAEPVAEAPITEEAAVAGGTPPVTTPSAAEVPPVVFEDTQPIQVVSDEMAFATDDEEDEASTGEIAAAEAAAIVSAAGGALPGAPVGEAAAVDEAAVSDEPAPFAEPAPTPAAAPIAAAAPTPAAAPVDDAATRAAAAEAEAAAASLTFLQRGVDLLNVSRIPRKIAETNEQLGMPQVHAGFDGKDVAVTFMWTMGWYRFRVDLDSSEVGMDDRGYEELSLQPNAGVRADGTVQLAPAHISRAAAQRAQEPTPVEPEAMPASEPEPMPAEPETPRQAAQKPPEFLSKSLLGQRSDDETASWEQTKARDFDWDR